MKSPGLTSKQLRRAAAIQERIETLTRELNQLLIVPMPSSDLAGNTGKGRLKRKRRGGRSVAVRAKLSRIAKARWKRAKAAGKARL